MSERKRNIGLFVSMVFNIIACFLFVHPLQREYEMSKIKREYQEKRNARY